MIRFPPFELGEPRVGVSPRSVQESAGGVGLQGEKAARSEVLNMAWVDRAGASNTRAGSSATCRPEARACLMSGICGLRLGADTRVHATLWLFLVPGICMACRDAHCRPLATHYVVIQDDSQLDG
ncbi:hypothetical protein PR048_015857 [Dryococelus australis]|uniref:Uncharacterized protein n=1 Tax=Dryococelus australis TaxID=614101 RepID=A0ABQ9HIM9_9NEOP|nr:hypothetical protein PR048_015857 [Dryococelus australis]